MNDEHELHVFEFWLLICNKHDPNELMLNQIRVENMRLSEFYDIDRSRIGT